MFFGSAREFFDFARSAAQDAERIGRQLAEMEVRAEGIGSGGFEPRVRSTPDPDRMAGRVVANADHKERLEARREEDYRVIDAACAVLYGEDNRSGLYALVGWPADAIYHHYLALRTWEDTAGMLGYSARYTQEQVRWALELADANGDMWTRLGQGFAGDPARTGRGEQANKEKA